MSDQRDEDLVEVRMLVPRSALVQVPPPPELISQANSLAVFGVPARRFLAIVRSPSFPGRVIRNGKLRLVRRADFLEALDRSDTDTERSDCDAPPRTSALAERLGLEAIPTSTRRAG